MFLAAGGGSWLLAGSRSDLTRQRVEFGADDNIVEGLVTTTPKHLREKLRVDLAYHHIAVGDRQRPAATVRRGPGVRAGRLGTDAKT